MRFALALLLMASSPSSAADWAIAVHGGAGVMARGSMTKEREAVVRAKLAEARDAGAKVLEGGGAALDAVEAAVRVLEDAPEFNAGRGAALARDGTAELDAAIMDGADLRAGAATGVTTTKNPIRAARAVMEHSPHVMLAGRPADALAAANGAEQVANSWFVTAERRKMLEAVLKDARVGGFDTRLRFGTVGAVARDAKGHLAAATSTGGLTGKWNGRVGDAPLIGAGTVADDRSAAVSATGSGEMFMRARVAGQIADRVRFGGQALAAAADAALAEVKALGGDGGVIAIGPKGAPVTPFNSAGMYRATATADGVRTVGIYGDE